MEVGEGIRTQRNLYLIMNFAQQRRYALSYLRWFRRHERRSYRLVRAWIRAVQDNVLSTLDRVGIPNSILRIDDMVRTGPIESLLNRIYQYTIGESAQREFDRLRSLLPKPNGNSRDITADAGFFSRVWQNTTAQMLNSSETAQRISGIAETTRAQIRRLLVQANADNVDVRTAASRIRTLLSGKGAKRRSLMIARTETTRAASAGHEAGALQSNIPLAKIWIATADTRTRDKHRAMIGRKPIPKDEPFIVGGKKMKYPGDPAGGADNCVNCRCVQVYVPFVGRSSFMESGTSIPDDSGFTPVDSVEEAEKYAKRFFNEVSYKGFTPEQANRVNRQLDTIYRDLKLDKLGFKIDKFDLKVSGKTAIGMSTEKMGKTSMHLRKEVYGTKELEEKYVSAAQKNYSLPKGVTRYSTATDMNIPSLEATIAHEFGHQLDYNFTLLTFKNTIGSFAKGEAGQLARQVSFYGISTIEEMFCELSALYFTGNKSLIPEKLLLAYETHLNWVNGLIDKRIQRLGKARKHVKRRLSYL